MTPLRCGYLLLLLLAGATYLPYLANPLVFDDVGALSPLNLMDYIFRIDIGNIMRWLPNATLAHTYLLTDGSIAAMRLGNLVLHMLTAIAVCKLVHELYVTVVPAAREAGEESARAVAVALIAAAIFAVHPLNVYGVGYLTQRTIIMSTLFMLLMLIAFTRWLVSGRSALWVWSALWYLLSVFCKEHSVMAPAAALLLALALRKQARIGVRDLAAPSLVFTAITVLIVLLRNLEGIIGASSFEVTAAEMISGAGNPQLQALMAGGEGYRISVLTQMGLYFKYLLLWLIPNPQWMAVDIRASLAPGLWTWPYWAGAAGFLVYPLLALVVIGRGGRAAMAGWILMVPWVLFATELSTARIQEPFVLYRTYLWFPLCGALPGLLASRFSVKSLAAAAVVLVCALVPLSWNRLHTFSDSVLLWDDAAKLLVRGDEIGAGRIYYNRGLSLLDAKRKLEALDDFNRVVALHPKFAPIRDGRARVLFELKRFDEALQDINISVALDPKRAGIFIMRAITLKQVGRIAEAAQDFRKACRMGETAACIAAERLELGIKSP